MTNKGGSDTKSPTTPSQCNESGNCRLLKANNNDSTRLNGDINQKTIFKSILHLDEVVTEKLAVCCSSNSKFGQFRPFMKVLEYSCHGIPWLTGVVFGISMTHNNTVLVTLINLLSALIADLVVITILKTLVHRKRPSHNEMDMFVTVSVDKFSFPSGHATRAALLMCFLVHHWSDSFSLDVWIVIWAVSVSFSRIVLGRHHMLDVLFGFFIGMLEYWALIHFLWLPSHTCNNIYKYIFPMEHSV